MKLSTPVNLKILSAIALAFLTQSVNAIPFTFEARSLGMGGVSVATADLATAAWANPAMLTNQPYSDDFSILIGVGAQLRDSDDLSTDIDDFQDANDRLIAARDANDIAGEINAVFDMSEIIQNLEGKNIALDASVVAAMGISFDSFAMAFSIRSDVISAGTVTEIDSTLLGVDDPTKNNLNLEGVISTEYGISFAKDFNIWDRKVSIGIKPKVVNLQGFSYKESIITIDGTDDITDQDNKNDLGTFTTVDMGAAIDLSESFRLGLNFRNLINDKFETKTGTLNFDTEIRMGAAYHNDFVTVGVDYDLRENKPLLANNSFNNLTTQYIALGAEFNAFEYVKLRAGAAKNIASGVSSTAGDPSYTLGVGFWLGFNLDIAATFTDNSVGGFLQGGFRF